MATLSTEELLQVLKKIRNLRAWAVREKVNAWAVRQALIITLELDRLAAIERGVRPKDLSNFDAKARSGAHLFIRALNKKRPGKH